LRFSVFLRHQQFQRARQELDRAQREIEANLSESAYWQVTWPLHLGSWYQRQGHMAEAREAYLEALNRATSTGRKDLEATIQVRFAELEAVLGNLAAARELAGAAREAFRELGKGLQVRRATDLLQHLGVKARSGTHLASSGQRGLVKPSG
jgi:tetratricopeptide (TPR) repeat protein